MDLGNGLQEGQISLRDFNSFWRQGPPSLHHIKLDKITVEDHLGRNIPVPTILCSAWQVGSNVSMYSSAISHISACQDFHYIGSGYCRYGLGHELVERGDYFVSRVEDHQIINHSEFSTTVKSGMVVEMGIVLREMAAFRDSRGNAPDVAI